MCGIIAIYEWVDRRNTHTHIHTDNSLNDFNDDKIIEICTNNFGVYDLSYAYVIYKFSVGHTNHCKLMTWHW